MTEVLYTGTLSAQQLTGLIAACTFPPDARFLGEQLPTQIIDQSERQNLLLFTWYTANPPFTSYTTGRIFHLDGELRWERASDRFQVVYLGSDQNSNVLEAHTCTIQPEFTQLTHDKKLQNVARHYFLFGKILSDDNERIPKLEDHTTYAEARIPRLLQYPIREQRKIERIGMQVNEYVHVETGQIFAYRFQALQAMKHLSTNKGAESR